MRKLAIRASAVIGAAAIMATGAAIANAANSFKGEVPPTLGVRDWMNSSPKTLAELKGEVVLLEFWSTT